MRQFENSEGSSFVIVGTASPNLIEEKDVDRIKSGTITYAARKIEEERIEISIFAEYVNAFVAPYYSASISKSASSQPFGTVNVALSDHG